MAPRERFSEPQMHSDISEDGDLRLSTQISQARGGHQKGAPTSQPRGGNREKGKPARLRGGRQEGSAPRDGGCRDGPSHSPAPHSWSGSWPRQ